MDRPNWIQVRLRRETREMLAKAKESLWRGVEMGKRDAEIDERVGDVSVDWIVRQLLAEYFGHLAR